MNPPIGPNKAIAASTGGAVTVVAVWLLGLIHMTVPPEVASAAAGLVAALLTYLVPHGGE